MKILGDGPPLAGKNGATRPTYRLQCECGAIFIRRKYAIDSGNTKSCGCLRRRTTAARGRANRKLGISVDPAMKRTYDSWRSMIGRCYQKGNASYKRYGAVGVTVATAWRTFDGFFKDMGIRPGPEYTIERVNGNKPYTKSNCRWATRAEQARNRKSTVWIEANGVTLTASEWAAMYGVSLPTILRRHRAGTPIGGKHVDN